MPCSSRKEKIKYIIKKTAKDIGAVGVPCQTSMLSYLFFKPHCEGGDSLLCLIGKKALLLISSLNMVTLQFIHFQLVVC